MLQICTSTKAEGILVCREFNKEGYEPTICSNIRHNTFDVIDVGSRLYSTEWKKIFLCIY